VQFVNALVEATRALPSARADRLALVGHSRGGGAVLQYLLRGNVQAAILHSSGYALRPDTRAGEFHVPIQVLHGTIEPDAAEAQITMSHWRVTSKRRCGGIRKQSRRVITKEEATTASSSTRLSATMS